MFVNENNDGLISINDTNTCDYSMQNKNTHESSEHNNYSDDYDELAYPFSKRIKLNMSQKRLNKMSQYNILLTLL
jgi:hypothetical protein